MRSQHVCISDKTDITFSVDDSGINLTIRDQPIPEDESEAKQALNQVANTLRLVCAYCWRAQLLFPTNLALSRKHNNLALLAALGPLEDVVMYEIPCSSLNLRSQAMVTVLKTPSLL